MENAQCICCGRHITITESASESFCAYISFNKTSVKGSGKTIVEALRSAHENVEAVVKLLKK